MVASYPFLNNAEKPAESVLAKNLSGIPNPFIVMSGGRYFRFREYKDFDAKKLTNPIDFHEVSLGGSQKVKFDIDAKKTELDAANLTREELWSAVVGGITNWTSTFTGLSLTDAASILAIADSSDETKFSRHVVVTSYYVPNFEYALSFAQWVYDHLPSEFQPFMDMKVYKKSQNLRMLGSSKGTRVKRALTNHKSADFMFTVTADCKVLTTMGKPLSKVATVAPTSDAYDEDEVKTLLSKYSEGHEFGRFVNNTASYRRRKPSMCPNCQQIHHKDNTFYAVINGDGEVFIRCRHSNPSTEIYAGIVAVKKQASGFSDDVYAESKFILDIPRFIKPRIPESAPIPDKFEVVKVHQEKFPDFVFGEYDTIIAKSNMGTGKTEAEDRYISTLEADEHVIIISMRKTFTQEIAKRFRDFTVYNSKPGKLADNRVIVQYESIHRIQTAGLDTTKLTLILDESESIITQIPHTKPAKAAECMAVFKWLYTKASRVILMDACAGERTYKLAGQRKRVKMIVNTFVRNPITDVYYNEPTSFIRNFAIACKNAVNEPINVVSSSKDIAIIMALCAKAQYPGLRVALYTCDKTPEQIAELDDVNASWVNYDVVIFTPTITAGVSFTKDHFHHQFVYLKNTSCDFITGIQMTGRVRSIKSGKAHIHITPANTNDFQLPTTAQSVEDALMSNISLLSNKVNISTAGLEVEIADDGINRTYNKTFTYGIHLMNIVHRCQSIAFYSQLFRRSRGSMGNKTEFAPKGSYPAIAEAMKNARKSYKEAEIKALCDALVESTTVPIEKEILTPTERAINDKLSLEALYSVTNEQITTDFVKKYNKPKVRRAYHNANTMFKYDAKEVREVVCGRVNGTEDTVRDISALLNAAPTKPLIGLIMIETILGTPMLMSHYETPIEINKSRIIEGLREAAGKLNQYKNFIKLNFKIDLDQILILSYDKIIQSVNRVAYDLFCMKFTTVRGAKNRATDKLQFGVDKEFVVGVEPYGDRKQLRPIL